VCGCEETVAGKGIHTLAFVGWGFLFLFCLYVANLPLLLSFFQLAPNVLPLCEGGDFQH
jgi:hypothetical protein